MIRSADYPQFQIRHTNAENMLETLNFLSVKKRIAYNTMVLLYKMEKICFLTTCALACIELVAHSLNTRSCDDFMLPNFRKASTAYNGMKIYNDIRRLNGFGTIINLTGFQTFCYDFVKRNF
jgi:hypothetical protein